MGKGKKVTPFATMYVSDPCQFVSQLMFAPPVASVLHVVDIKVC